MTITIMTYDEWQRIKRRSVADELREGGEVCCYRCDGWGEIEDEGVETGIPFDVCCPTCDGEGVLNLDGGELPKRWEEHLITKHANPQQYAREVVGALVQVSRWTGRELHELLADCGIPVYCLVTGKQVMAAVKAPGGQVFHGPGGPESRVAVNIDQVERQGDDN